MAATEDRTRLQLQIARTLTSTDSRIKAPKTMFDSKPVDWRDLEGKVRRIFEECNCVIVPSKAVKTVRGKVDIDVLVRDETRRPHQVILCECKLWRKKVSKTVVHAFRTVVHDSGANLGYIISDSGFQSGAHEAALNANIRLVTWKEFQAELFDRWFDAMERRLTEACDLIYDLKETGENRYGDRTLMDAALDSGGGDVFNRWNLLERQYVQYAFSSSKIGARKFRRFPFRSIDPSGVDQSREIKFKSPRMYFDVMLANAPQAFRDYVSFIFDYTGGRCGTAQLLDDATVKHIRIRKSTMTEVRKLLGSRSLIKRVPDGEIWYFNGSMTNFRLPGKQGDRQFIGSAETFVRTLELEFGTNGVLRRIKRGRYVRKGAARL